MAKRGTKKRRSVEQENDVAAAYPKGVASPSSGAHDDNDVSTALSFIECKYKGAPGEKEAYSYTIKLEWLEEVVDAGAKLGKEGALAIRLYAPESPLADADGNVDLTVRLMDTDAGFEHYLDAYA